MIGPTQASVPAQVNVLPWRLNEPLGWPAILLTAELARNHSQKGRKQNNKYRGKSKQHETTWNNHTEYYISIVKLSTNKEYMASVVNGGDIVNGGAGVFNGGDIVNGGDVHHLSRPASNLVRRRVGNIGWTRFELDLNSSVMTSAGPTNHTHTNKARQGVTAQPC